jgi:hypothetical protein
VAAWRCAQHVESCGYGYGETLHHVLRRFGGYATELRSSPNVQCETYARDIPTERWGETREFWQQAAEWLLLLQAESDMEDGVSYGGAGLVTS